MPISRRTFLALGPVGAAMLPSLSAAQTATPSVALSDSLPRDTIRPSSATWSRCRTAMSRVSGSCSRIVRRWPMPRGTGATETGRRRLAPHRTWATGRLPRCSCRPARCRRFFSAAMLGQLEVVKAIIAAAPGIERTRGAHGITLLAHAKAGGAADVVRYLDTLPGANVPATCDDRWTRPNGQRWRAHTRLARAISA